MRLLALAAIGLLAGCAAVGGGPDMSVGQLRALAADKNASAVCSKIMGPWGTGIVVSVNLDETRQNGTVTVNPDCTLSVSTVNLPPAPKQVSPVTLSLTADGNCVRTQYDTSGRAFATATVNKERCQ